MKSRYFEARHNRSSTVALTLLLLSALLYLPAAEAQEPATRQTIHGRVVEVTDGDSFTIQQPTGYTRIRLFGVDAPESGQAHGEKAAAFLSRTIAGRLLTIRVVDRDPYGRLVAIVESGNGTTLNEMLLEEGHAWWYREYAPQQQRYEELEASARRNQRGLWANSGPVAPWKWRQGSRGGSDSS